MNEAEKERLIKKDIESIENRVRHAFNQGYEMGMKERQNTCGDAVSRAEAYAVVDRMLMGDRNHKIIALEEIQNLPSVTPQQRTGEWIEHFDEIGKWYECDQCHTDWGGPVNYCPNCGAKMEVEE